MFQLLNYTNIRMVEGMKNVSEQNADVTAEMKELTEKNAEMTVTMANLMRQNAEATEHMRLSTEQNANATRKMAELAEVSQRQAAHGARQSQSMAVLAYDAKRDSEVMKAITVVTILFLPATFVSVRPVLHLKLTTHPPSRQSSAWGSLISITTGSKSPHKVGFISFARFRSPLLSSERHLRGYGGQGRRKRSLLITMLVKRSHKRLIH